ncbi:MAG: hypothetical protein RBS38_06500 [Bacteroidales bacterium]|jgi:hypothetical protein|nr:hypothetical protein [Bacteroidales bacterium]
MKKIFWIAIMLLLILFFVVVKPIRTNNTLKNIASDELRNALYEEFGQPHSDSILNQLTGPLILEQENYVEFKWFKVLEWGDTASIYIDVYRSPSSFSWRDNYFWQRVTMNHQWGYLFGAKSEFKNVLPIKYENKTLILSSLQLYPNQWKYYENSEVLISPDRLFYFLKKGYFSVLEKKEEYTVVAFYQPIGNIYVIAQNKTDTINTMSAKVLINEVSEILIIPHNAPPELWSKTVK